MESPVRTSWIPRPLTAFVLGLAVLLLSGTIWCYAYAQRRLEAYSYLESLDAIVDYTPAVRNMPIPKWLAPVELIIIVKREPCDLSRITPLSETRVLGIGGPVYQRTELRRFQHLRQLSLADPEFTDADLTLIEHLPLKLLTLENASVTDEGLERIAKFSLVELDLLGTKVTRRGLEALRGCAGLEKITVSNPPFTREEAKSLRESGLPVQVMNW